MPHGKPYYGAHVEQLGYTKGIDLLAYWMQRTDLSFSPSLVRLMDQVRQKVTIRSINRKRFSEEMQILREIFNSGWQHNWGFVPFTEHEFASMGEQLKFLVPDDMIHIAEIDSVPCAFIVGLPNINEAIADLNRSAVAFRLGQTALATKSERRTHRAGASDGRSSGISVQPHWPGHGSAVNRGITRPVCQTPY